MVANLAQLRAWNLLVRTCLLTSVCSLLLLELKAYLTKYIKALFIPKILSCGEALAKDGSISF